MKKEKIIIDNTEIPVEGKSISFSGVYDPHSLDEIEQFVLDAGSDDLPVFGGKFQGGIHCQQIPDEIAPCILAILESGESIKSYLEIGAAAGGTIFLFNHFFRPGKIILIDDNKHHKAILRPEVLRGIERKEIIGNSRDPEVIEKIFGPFDLILVDGDHSYAGLTADLKNYLPMLAVGGFLILHDTVYPNAGFGVGQVVKEMRNNNAMEFIGEYVSQKHPQPCGVALFRGIDR